MHVWILEQIDTETRNDMAMTTVLGAFTTPEAAIAEARKRWLDDQGFEDGEHEEPKIDPQPEDGRVLVHEGEPDEIFVYCVTLHDLDNPVS